VCCDLSFPEGISYYARYDVWLNRCVFACLPLAHSVLVLTARRDFDHWTNISADCGPVVEGPSWLSTKQESPPERLTVCDHPNCPPRVRETGGSGTTLPAISNVKCGGRLCAVACHSQKELAIMHHAMCGLTRCVLAHYLPTCHLTPAALETGGRGRTPRY